jgi:hypothetical protein
LLVVEMVAVRVTFPPERTVATLLATFVVVAAFAIVTESVLDAEAGAL